MEMVYSKITCFIINCWKKIMIVTVLNSVLVKDIKIKWKKLQNIQQVHELSKQILSYFYQTFVKE